MVQNSLFYSKFKFVIIQKYSDPSYKWPIFSVVNIFSISYWVRITKFVGTNNLAYLKGSLMGDCRQWLKKHTTMVVSKELTFFDD